MSDYLDTLKSQWELPSEERRALVVYEGNNPLNERGVEIATRISKQYLLPLSAIALIPTKNGFRPYITSDGMLWRLHNDTRGVPDIVTEVLDWGDQTGRARVKCTITIGGATYVGHAQLTLDEERKKNPRADTDTVVMKTETKAVRRTCLRAVGLPFPVFEEAKEWVAAIEVPHRTEDDAQSGNAPRNQLELLALGKKLGLVKNDIEMLLGRSLAEVTDFAEAARAIQA